MITATTTTTIRSDSNNEWQPLIRATVANLNPGMRKYMYMKRPRHEVCRGRAWVGANRECQKIGIVRTPFIPSMVMCFATQRFVRYYFGVAVVAAKPFSSSSVSNIYLFFFVRSFVRVFFFFLFPFASKFLYIRISSNIASKSAYDKNDVDDDARWRDDKYLYSIYIVAEWVYILGCVHTWFGSLSLVFALPPIWRLSISLQVKERNFIKTNKYFSAAQPNVRRPFYVLRAMMMVNRCAPSSAPHDMRVFFVSIAKAPHGCDTALQCLCASISKRVSAPRSTFCDKMNKSSRRQRTIIKKKKKKV